MAGSFERSLLACLVGALALLALTGRASAAEFPEITRQERELIRVQGHPDAPAVVLFKKGRFMLLDPETRRVQPRFLVQVRRKILTEAGKNQGEVTLPHSGRARLQKLEGRTVLPDGRVIPLPKSAQFTRRVSKAEKKFVTSITFPAVEVGAILDFSYEIRVPSAFFLEPWPFQEDVPTLYSEIAYNLPGQYVVNTLLQDPFGMGIQQKVTPGGPFVGEIRAWGEYLPAVPDEPFAPPFADRVSRFMVIPAEFQNPPFKSTPLLKSWAKACELIAPEYEKAARRSGAVNRKAKALTAGLPGVDLRARTQAVYLFVRDGIETEDLPGIELPEGSTADSVLAAGRGGATEKALLLQAMLEAVGVTPRLVWAAERADGKVNMEFFTPLWFDRAIVAVDLNGERVFLDPSDRSLGFGRLPPGLEGMPALLFSPENPEVITLPSTPAEESLRQAKIDLELDGTGRLSGQGRLTLGGHHAWTRLHWQEDAEKTARAWTEWLAGELEDFAISAVQVIERVEERRVEVTWSMAQRTEEVLGDEVTLAPSRPLGPLSQPFQVPADKRLSPVLFDFGDRSEVELTLRWPEGWTLEALPAAAGSTSPAGSLTATVEVEGEARRLTYRRQLKILAREYTKEQYGAVQELFAQTERHDAQRLVLVRRGTEMESGALSHLNE